MDKVTPIRISAASCFGQDARRGGGGQDDEGEFAAGSEQQADFAGLAPVQAEKAREARDKRRFDQGEQESDAERRAGMGDHLQGIEARADRDEEQAEQQALERVDRGFDGAAEFGFRQQQPGDEGAERHGQAGRTRP